MWRNGDRAGMSQHAPNPLNVVDVKGFVTKAPRLIEFGNGESLTVVPMCVRGEGDGRRWMAFFQVNVPGELGRKCMELKHWDWIHVVGQIKSRFWHDKETQAPRTAVNVVADYIARTKPPEGTWKVVGRVVKDKDGNIIRDPKLPRPRKLKNL